MAGLELRGLGKRYGGATVVSALSLHVEDGEFMVLVGPSGCGKSTTLRMIAGLETASEGQILIDATDITHRAPAERGVAMVFQSYALYPHMTVAQNMGFGLKMSGLPRPQVDAAVRRAAGTLQLEALLERLPRELSGGQRQRVAIGRAIVREPKVFLFDEPLSNLDASLRTQMRLELSRLHERLRATVVYVTHDQVEAMTLGHRIAVFNQGRIEQVGTPLQIYRQPATRFVAGFLGSPQMNFLPARAQSDGHGGWQLDLGAAGRLAWPAAGISELARVRELGIRPEHLLLHPAASRSGAAATVEWVEHLGDVVLVHCALPGVPATVCVKADAALGGCPSRGSAVRLEVLPGQAHLFDAEGVSLQPMG